MNLPTSPYLSEIKTLRDRVEELEARNAFLNSQIQMADYEILRAIYPLTKSEAKILLAMCSGRTATKKFLTAVLGASDGSGVVAVHLSHIRRKLPWVQFKVVWGTGWSMHPDSCRLIRNAMQRKAA